MAWGRANLYGRMSATRSVVIVTAPTGSKVSMDDGSVTRYAPERNGVWTFVNVKSGLWTLRAVKSPQQAEKTLNISQPDFYRERMAYRVVPEFSYSGSYEVLDDNNQPVDPRYHQGNWKIRFLTSGLLVFLDDVSALPKMDMFAVGGGGGGACQHGGGGGGRVACRMAVTLENVRDQISIGDGGAGEAPGGYGFGSSGGSTYGFNLRADGGDGGTGGGTPGGGDGGNGGGGGGPTGGIGGYGGSSGGALATGRNAGTTLDAVTMEFCDPNSNVYYAGGGGGGGSDDPGGKGGKGGGGNGAGIGQNVIEYMNGTPNTGGGGGAGFEKAKISGGNGGSGVFIIRNARG